MKTISKKKEEKKKYLINEKIYASQLRVISEEGKQIGILSKEEALKIAKSKNLDLILIAEKAQPPVAKIFDFNKFLYQEKKKQSDNKKSAKKGETKDIKLSLFIGENDLQRLIKKGQDFLKAGYQLRVNLPLRGRETTKKEMGFNLINRYLNSLGEVNLAMPVKLQGQVIRCVVSRKTK